MNAAEFVKIVGGLLIRPMSAATCRETFHAGRVTACQSESYVGGKGVGCAVRTVTIAAFEGDVPVNRCYLFCFLIFVDRFFYNGDTAWTLGLFRLVRHVPGV